MTTSVSYLQHKFLVWFGTDSATSLAKHDFLSLVFGDMILVAGAEDLLQVLIGVHF